MNKFYLYIYNNEIIGKGQGRCIESNIKNIEVLEDIYLNSEKYIYKYNEIVLNPDYEAEQAQKERERLDGLSMKRGDVFEALILAKGLGKAEIRSMIENAELDATTKLLYLNRFDEAIDFYRGYPIFDLLGEQLNITPAMLDEFFETKDYKKLIAPVEEEEPTVDEVTEPESEE